MKRRFFLKGAGGALLAAPFLSSLREPARAQSALLPRRSILFHTPCGCLTNRWFPKVEHGPLDAAALAGTTLEVLTPFVDKLLVPRGLRAQNTYGVTQSIDPHVQAMASKLTCAPVTTTTPHYAESHSLDHEIARQLNPGGVAPLVLSPAPPSTNPTLVLSYSDANTPFPSVASPFALYSQLSGVLGSGTLPEYRLRRGESIIDAVRDDLDTYRRLDVSARDRNRVDDWLELLRNTERGVLTACSTSSVGLDVASVEASIGTGTTAEQFTLGADLMIQLMALNMLCDVNRSFVLTFPGYVVFDWDGIHHTHDHDGLAHRTGDFTVGGNCLPGVLEMLAEIDGWYAQKFAKLVGLLAELPEGEGSLLGNTATVWLQEFSDGSAFNLNNMPIVIAGSAGGYLRQGVAVSLEDEPIGPGNSESTCAAGGAVTGNAGSVGGNVPINKLYVTLLNALGCRAADGGEVTSFGVFDGMTVDSGISDPGELSTLKA